MGSVAEYVQSQPSSPQLGENEPRVELGGVDDLSPPDAAGPLMDIVGQTLREMRHLDSRVNLALRQIQLRVSLGTEDDEVENIDYETLIEAKERLSLILPQIEALEREVRPLGIVDEMAKDYIPPIVDRKGKRNENAPVSKEQITLGRVQERVEEIIDDDDAACFEWLEECGILDAAPPPPPPPTGLLAMLDELQKARQALIAKYKPEGCKEGCMIHRTEVAADGASNPVTAPPTDGADGKLNHAPQPSTTPRSAGVPAYMTALLESLNKADSSAGGGVPRPSTERPLVSIDETPDAPLPFLPQLLGRSLESLPPHSALAKAQKYHPIGCECRETEHCQPIASSSRRQIHAFGSGWGGWGVRLGAVPDYMEDEPEEFDLDEGDSDFRSSGSLTPTPATMSLKRKRSQ